MIFKIYINQTNVNLIEVENEINLIKDTKSKEELEKIRNQIINKKKEEKLNLFSRSHFSNLENSITITFK